jgi:uncharacterized oligopeptide transporter (OPT) family protein
VSATFPAAIVALAAGAIFTIPAFLLVSVDGQRLIGGIIGVLFITPLLVVDADLPYKFMGLIPPSLGR